jgi:hypothetical protein
MPCVGLAPQRSTSYRWRHSRICCTSTEGWYQYTTISYITNIDPKPILHKINFCRHSYVSLVVHQLLRRNHGPTTPLIASTTSPHCSLPAIFLAHYHHPDARDRDKRSRRNIFALAMRS